jgi:PHP family Zn ribbon phosphoesterase
MKYLYDLHIHSGLSPCADNDMSPTNIVAMASLKGLEIIAVSDHNSIKNVRLTMEIGRLMDILVVPAIEIQTNEDIHILCLFQTYQNLEDFYNSISFSQLENKIKAFGNQCIYDENDNFTEEKTLLFASADISESEIAKRAAFYNGIAIPAHIDRDAYGILAVLGTLPKGYTCLEVSKSAPKELIEKYNSNHNLIFNSDAHTLQNIGQANSTIELPQLSTQNLLNYLSLKK